MNGAEHYREAERLLAEAVSWETDEQQARWDATVIGVAQGHAMLAQVAATIEQVAARGPGDLPAEWNKIIWPQSEDDA